MELCYGSGPLLARGERGVVVWAARGEGLIMGARGEPRRPAVHRAEGKYLMKIIAWGQAASLGLLMGLSLALAGGGAAAAAGPSRDKPYFRPGDLLPTLELKVPREAWARDYLGLEGDKAWFQLGRIPRPLVLIEAFNMYCGVCQQEAPVVNRLHDLLRKDPLGRALALVGVGIGNSEYEAGLFRRKFQIGFPIFSDGDFRVHTLLRQPDTPFFILARLLGDGRVRVLFTRLGPLGEPGEFLELIRREAAKREE